MARTGDPAAELRIPALERNSNFDKSQNRRHGGSVTQPGVKLARSIRVRTSAETQRMPLGNQVGVTSLLAASVSVGRLAQALSGNVRGVEGLYQARPDCEPSRLAVVANAPELPDLPGSLPYLFARRAGTARGRGEGFMRALGVNKIATPSATLHCFP